MTKQQAHERIDRGDLTWGQLKHFIEQCWDQDHSVPSVVNKSMTRRQALDILSAALAPCDDNEFVVSCRYTSARNARGSLLATNVLRETHFRVRGTPEPSEC